VSTGPRVSLVLPCFNEGARIASSMATLDVWFGGQAEILVMDDGSQDDTAEHAERHAGLHPRCRVHRLPHRGKGAALRAAIPLVRGEQVVFMDADLAFDKESVARVVEALAGADMAIGNRRHPGSRYSVPVELFAFLFRRHVVGLAFNTFVRAVIPVGVRDTQCGLKAFRRGLLERVAPALTTDGFALDVELIVAAAALGVRPVDVPVNVRYESARSGVRLLASGWSTAGDILRIAVGRARGRYRPSAEARSA
jgi:glycosyltransferase involved in cell wall biosynthesis